MSQDNGKVCCNQQAAVLRRTRMKTYGFCVYHEIECDYDGNCIECPHNTEEDTEWFKQDEEQAESEG